MSWVIAVQFFVAGVVVGIFASWIKAYLDRPRPVETLSCNYETCDFTVTAQSKEALPFIRAVMENHRENFHVRKSEA